MLNEYQDCFNKIGWFHWDQYHIELIKNLTPVVHPLCIVPIHILPLHKAELQKMITDDINAEGTETRLGQFNCLNVKETPDRKKVRLCFDPKDLNKNICCENY